MKHEDFFSLDVNDVLTRTLDYCAEQTGAAAVHWISSFGLDRVRAEREDRFASEDIMAYHLVSRPAMGATDLQRLWARVGADPDAMNVVTVKYRQDVVGFLHFESPKTLATLGPGLDLAAKYLSFAYQHLAARADSYLDELTGLYNQRYLPMALDLEIARAKREGQAFTLLFLDVDRFKQVNDGRGHWTGSKLLIELGNVLRTQVRACDYCFRYGGDEFIVLLGNVDAPVAVGVAERIRQAVESNVFRVEQHEINLTVSIGLASYPTHAETSASLIQIADEAMYNGKRKSRNIVFVAS